MIAEPSSDLWAAIKQKYNAWPPDNEDVANQLGTHLGTFASAASNGHADLHRTGQSLGSAWRDSAGADMVDKASSVASDWSKIAQTAQTQGALAQSYGHALSVVKQTISGTVAANEPLYELLSASSLLHPLRTRLVNHLAGAFQNLVGADNQSVNPSNSSQFVWNHATVGVCYGGALGFGPVSGSGTECLIHAPDGHWAITRSAAEATGPSSLMEKLGSAAKLLTGFGAGAGVGIMVSDGQHVTDQAGPFNHAEVSAGDTFGGSFSYDTGTNGDGVPVHTMTLMGGLFDGMAGQWGQSTTDVTSDILGFLTGRK